jgi:hypothetical protein
VAVRGPVEGEPVTAPTRDELDMLAAAVEALATTVRAFQARLTAAEAQLAALRGDGR